MKAFPVQLSKTLLLHEVGLYNRQESQQTENARTNRLVNKDSKDDHHENSPSESDRFGIR